MKNIQEEFYPVALTIAGSDSGGGAGIQADLRTFNTAGVFGCSVITAITAQNPKTVTAVTAIDADSVAAQFDAVVAALTIAAAKTGMLANAAVIRAIAPRLAKCKFPLIVDPVMVSTSGHRLLEAAAMDALKTELLPLAAWITPNIPEAEWLLGRKLPDHAACAEAAAECSERFRAGCIIKGGHAGDNGGRAIDFVAFEGKLYTLATPRLTDLNRYAAHGTGCTFSAAIAAGFAAGKPWKRVLREAKALVLGSLSETAMIGPGIEAMYPPLGEYYDQTVLAELDSAGVRR